MSKADFLCLTLELETAIIGERVKGGVFRPCQEIIPSSTLKGALKHNFGLEITGAGFFLEGTYQLLRFTYSLRDKLLQTAKLPLTTAYLAPSWQKSGAAGTFNPGDSSEYIRALVYTPYTPENEKALSEVKGVWFRLGALKSRGFGRCRIVEIAREEEDKDFKKLQGHLKVKILEEEKKLFSVEVLSPIYGFLFVPDSASVGGKYKRALFPGSLVKAPDFFLEGGETYFD